MLDRNSTVGIAFHTDPLQQPNGRLRRLRKRVARAAMDREHSCTVISAAHKTTLLRRVLVEDKGRYLLQVRALLRHPWVGTGHGRRTLASNYGSRIPYSAYLEAFRHLKIRLFARGGGPWSLG
jgi:hypothetical protein